MKKTFSLKKVYIIVSLLFLLIFSGTCIILRTLTSDPKVFLLFTIFTFLLLICVFILFCTIFHKLTLFTRELHKTLDSMIEGTYFSPDEKYDETLLSQINHHLGRLYSILENTKNSVNAEKVQLQQLISDISHQLKTPMTTLRLTESAMEKAITKLISHQYCTSEQTGIFNLFPCKNIPFGNRCDKTIPKLSNDW